MTIKPHLWDFGAVIIDMVASPDGVFETSTISEPKTLGGINRDGPSHWGTLDPSIWRNQVQPQPEA